MTNKIITNIHDFATYVWPEYNKEDDDLITFLSEKYEDTYSDIIDKMSDLSGFHLLSFILPINKPIYVEIIKGERRETVAKLIGIDLKIFKNKPILDDSDTKYEFRIMEINNYQVEVEERNRPWKVKPRCCEFLEGSHKTKFVENPIEESQLEDIFGVKPTLGSYIIAANNRRQLITGPVERITEKTFVIHYQTEKRSWKSEFRVTQNHEFIVADDGDILDKLILKKLAS